MKLLEVGDRAPDFKAMDQNATPSILEAIG